MIPTGQMMIFVFLSDKFEQRNVFDETTSGPLLFEWVLVDWKNTEI